MSSSNERANSWPPEELPTAVIFDMDGVIFDTEPIWLEAETELLARRGKVFPPEFARKIMGVPGGKAMQMVAEEFGLSETGSELTLELNGIFHDMLETRLSIMPGFLDRLTLLETLGIPRAVATSTERKLAHSMLGRFGLVERFACILTRDDVTHGKPHPEIYLAASDQLGITPARAVVLEDSLAGMQSANTAGCLVIGLRHPLTASLEFPHAHLVVDHHSDPQIEMLFGR